MEDLVAELNRTSRTVTAGHLRGASAHVVELRRHLRAPVADVWDACTDPERVRRWFLPLTGDLRAGGNFQLEGNARGTIAACDPPHRLELTWEFGEAEASLVSLGLNPAGPQETEFVLQHIVPDDDRWAQYGPGAVGVGWDLAVAALAHHLVGDDHPDADQMGPALMRESAASWGAAHEAAGTTPAAARNAAARTSNFYVPDQPPDA
jgi:uncharacterized protein YndB with AHSA1/START domain